MTKELQIEFFQVINGFYLFSIYSSCGFVCVRSVRWIAFLSFVFYCSLQHSLTELQSVQRSPARKKSLKVCHFKCVSFNISVL